jgi:hypothetical protein
MAQIRYRANLSAKDWVFMAQGWGRSVIMKQYDQNFSRQIVSPTDPDKDIGIPQIFYCHNVMPAAQGFQSVGYLPSISSGSVHAGTYPYQIVDIPGTAGAIAQKLLFALQTNGVHEVNYDVYYWNGQPGGSWTYIQTIALNTYFNNRDLITSAFVDGNLYVYFPYTGCYIWGSSTLTSQTLTGLTATQTFGILESFGYMIAWGLPGVYWSSTLTPTDFTPSLITGAGGGSVEGAQGDIYMCVPHIFGFIVFSSKNCVSAVYSGNSRYPFNFRKIIGGGGISQQQYPLAAIDAESGNVYAWTTAGLQLISVTQAQVVFPELANYLSGSRFEDFNDTLVQFVYTDGTPGFINRQLTVVSQRYLCVSYGILNTSIPTFSHVMVYDIAMKRWGKLKFTHVQVLESPNTPTAEFTSRSNFCLMDTSGTIWNVDFEFAASQGGTMILGKYQHSRDRLITLEQIDIDFVQNANNLNVYDMVTFDGKTFQAPVEIPAIANTNAPQYATRLSGMNHSLIFQGIFTLDSLMLTYHTNGRR